MTIQNVLRADDWDFYDIEHVLATVLVVRRARCA
jgi:hypothetical protein